MSKKILEKCSTHLPSSNTLPMHLTHPCNFPQARTHATFGAGPDDYAIFMSDVNCTGDEDFLFECDYSTEKQHSCQHEEDAGVVCGRGELTRRANGENNNHVFNIFLVGVQKRPQYHFF